MVRPRMVWPRSAANTSPVMKVWKPLDAAALRHHPLAVGAGQADQPGARVFGGPQGQHAQHLGLFAAHHVGQLPGLQQAGHDVQRLAAGAFHPGQPLRQRIERGGRVQVARVAPALGTAHHAAGEQRKVRRGSQPVAAGVLQGALEGRVRAGVCARGRGRQVHDAPGPVAQLQYAAPVAQAVGAQRTGAPVEGDEAGGLEVGGVVVHGGSRLSGPSAAPAGRAGARCRSGRGAPRSAWAGTGGGRPRRRSRRLPSSAPWR